MAVLTPAILTSEKTGVGWRAWTLGSLCWSRTRYPNREVETKLRKATADHGSNAGRLRSADF